MAQTSWPFENIDTTETQFSQWAKNINEGVKQGNGDELEVTADGTGMTVSVGSGQSLIRGHYYSSTATESLAISASDPTNPRIDAVVLELDPTANTILLKVLAGTPDASPVAPTLTQTDAGIYQLALAYVDVAATVLAIESGDVTDKRGFMFSGIGKWTTANRPTNPVQYETTGYNTTLNAHEFWNGTDWVGFADPITTEGDLIVGGASGVPERLPVGTDDQVLTVVSGVPEWADAGGGGASVTGTPGSVVADTGKIKDVGYEITGLVDGAHSGGFYQYGSHFYNPVNDNTYGTENIFTSSTRSAIYVTVNGNSVVAVPGISQSRNGIYKTSYTTITRQMAGYDPGTNAWFRYGYDSGTALYILERSTDDGANWTVVIANLGNSNFRAVHGDSANGGLFVWNSNNGAYFYSTNGGVSWTANTISTSTITAINSVVYSEGAILVCGWLYDGSQRYVKILRSTNGMVNYSTVYSVVQDSSVFSSYSIAHNGLTGANSRFVAAAQYTYNNNHNNMMLYSSDGVSWTGGGNLNTYMNRLFGGNGVFIFTRGTTSVYNDGEYYLSTDGTTFTTKQIGRGSKTRWFHNQVQAQPNSKNWTSSNVIFLGDETVIRNDFQVYDDDVNDFRVVPVMFATSDFTNYRAVAYGNATGMTWGNVYQDPFYVGELCYTRSGNYAFEKNKTQDVNYALFTTNPVFEAKN